MTACPDDDRLLALLEGQLDPDELSSMDLHLESCVMCREVVATLASQDDARSAGILVQGARAGRFVIESLAGRGASGVVYVAHDPELDRRVAVKVLTLGGRDPELLRSRMLREAQAMARLSHPNVVTVFEVGQLDQALFVAMELATGTSLREFLASNRERLTADAVVALYRQAGEGLAAAHAAGLVHRDFKPDNVVVDGNERVKVTDFGLARATDEEERPAERGALVGTPAYMSPEQLRADEADARSDQFSFCVSLWEGLFGVRPFEGTTVKSLLQAISDGPKEPTRGKASGRVVRALTRGLSSRADDRFASMSELLVMLAPPARRGWAMAMGATATAAALVAVAVTYGRTAEADVCAPSRQAIDATWNDPRRAEVRAAFANADAAHGGEEGRSVVQAIDGWASAHAAARYDACVATHVLHEQTRERLEERAQCLDSGRASLDVLVSELVKGDRPTLAFAGDAVSQLPLAMECSDPRLARSGSGDSPDGEVARRVEAIDRAIALGRVRVATAELGSARDIAAGAAREADETHHLPAIARAELLRADALRGLADYVQATAAARASLLAAEEANDEPSIVRAWLALTAIEGELGRFDAAAEHAAHADAVVARMRRPETLEMLVRSATGVVHYNRNEHDAAQRDLDAALAIARRIHGEDSPQVARLLTNLGNLARAEGKLDESLSLHRRALALDSARYGPKHPICGRHHHNIAGVLRLTSTPDDALPEYQLALSLKEAALGEHPEVALTENSLGLYFAARGRVQEARPHYERALAIYARNGHGQRAMVEHNLGLLAGQAPAASPAEVVAPTASAPAAAAKAMPVRSAPLPARAVPPPAGVYGAGQSWD